MRNKLTLKAKVRYLFIFGVVFSLTIFIASHLGYNTSNSVGFKVYAHFPVNKIKRGNYYIIDYEGKLIIKKALCLPKETVVRKENTFLCNGEEIAQTLIFKSSTGDILPQYYGGYLDEEVFLLGDSANSYDSKYFGVIPINNVIREVYPLW